jgi:hypothetical protein
MKVYQNQTVKIKTGKIKFMSRTRDKQPSDTAQFTSEKRGLNYIKFEACVNSKFSGLANLEHSILPPHLLIRISGYPVNGYKISAKIDFSGISPIRAPTVFREPLC